MEADQRYVGEWVELLPLSKAARLWTKEHGATVKLLKRRGEKFTVRSEAGKQKTFGPREATWGRK